MKTIVRCFVVALAVTGFAATAAVPAAKVSSTAKTSAMPAPRCTPGTPGCGFGGW